MKKIHYKIALFIIWLVIMLPIVEAQSMSFQEAGDSTPPEISTAQLTHGPQTVVTWATDEAANSKVEFGVDTTLNQTATKPELETAHSLIIQTTPGATYYYKITSCDAVGNCKSTNVEDFVAGPFYVQANIPRYAKSTKLDVAGSTRPGATVSVTVNGAEVRKDEIEDGEFLFKNVQLLKAANTVQLKAALGAETAEANYQVDIDDKPPIINVTMPAVVTTPSVTAKVKVSEPVNLTVELAKPTGDKPFRPTELKDDKVAANRVDLSWKKVEGITEYGVYRNDKRIAVTTSPQYVDISVGAGKQYKYQVSAVNDKCIESDLSDIVTVTTPAGSNTEQPAQEKQFTCEKPKQTLSFEGQKDVQVQLQEGENFVTFTAVDKAGYKSIAEERVLYDTGPPKFLETNLKQLTPTYSQEITTRGKISERGSVTAFVNGKPQKTEPTAEDGSFSIKIKLERTINYTAEQTRSSLDTGISWKSKVKLEAIDAAGLKATSDEVQIEYALCGSGTWIDVKLTEPLPGILNPRLLIEGIQQLGMGFTYEYKGGYAATINPRDIRVKKLNLAPEFQKEYDNGLITHSTPPIRAQRGKKPTGAGYVQINFLPIEDPWALPEKGKDKPEQAPSNATMYMREERISQHREGDCLVPGFGCMRLFLELEIPFQEEVEQLGYLPEQKGGTIEQKKLINRVQRTCINVEVAIDKRIPPDYIPSGLLRTIRDVLTEIIDTIDKIIKPIETIGKYLFYACVAGTFLSFVPIFLEKYNCEYKKFEQIAGGEGKFDPNVAAIGACEEEYSGKEESLNNCKTCEQWKSNRKKFERTYQQICDRTMCPAAPSLQYYLKTKGRSKLTPVKAPTAAGKLSDYTKGTEGLQLGSDCAAWAQSKQTEAQKAADKEAKPGQPRLRVPPSKFFTTQQIEDIYKDWLKHEPDTEETEGTTGGTVNCAGLHPATPECCGYEYMQEWSSACGISALGSGLDTFDEIKESTCLAAQKANKKELPGLNPGEETSCEGVGSILNAISGFCDKEGQPTPETIPVVPFQGSAGEQGAATGRLAELGLGTNKDRWMYLLMISSQTAKEYDLKLGYIVETVEFDQSGKSKDVQEDRKHYVTAKVEGVELPETIPSMQDKYFSQPMLDKYYQNQLDEAFYKDFQQYLCQQAGYAGTCDAKGREVYRTVAEKIGTPDQEYIIRPNDGLINSVRCLCFPTILGYLKLWRKIMAEVRNCVNTILLTGDGESGVCNAIISKYVCDLLYEVLACFTQKFGSPGGSGARAEGPGDILGALTSAGTEMSRSVESRYGDSGMYKAVFVDRKLVHSICMFAFTGTWNFDLATVFDQSIDTIPIDSQALMYPCNRRFVAFNPATRPGGLVTWLYHFGVFVAAGADVDVELHLVCSGGFKCKESDGFENGKCDCVAPRDIPIMPQELPTRIKKNDILNQEVFFTMTAGPPETNIRYDKAYLKYTYKDGTKVVSGQTDPCNIGLTGGTGSVPAFCRFDILSQSFRCHFGEAEGALRFQSATAIYPYTAPQAYAVKDNLNVELKIQQDYTAGEANIKHLQYEILNPAGQIVESNKDGRLFPLSINGDYTKIIGTAESQDPIHVKKEWFGAAAGAGTAQVSEWYSGTGEPGSLAGSAARPVVERSSLKIVEAGVQTTGQYVLVLTKQAGSPTYEIYRGTSPSPTTAGFARSGAPICLGPLPAPFSTINCQDATKTVTIQITDVRASPDKNDRYEVYIGFGQAAGATPCDGAARFLPQPFRIKFTAFDSDRYGQPTDQVTLDPLTGKDGIIEVLLNVVCADKDDPEFKAKITGVPTAEKIADQLKGLLRTMLGEEESKLLDAKKDADPLVVKTADEVTARLQSLINDENAKASQLTNYIKGLEAAEAPQLKTLASRVKGLQEALGPATSPEMEPFMPEISLLLENIQMAALTAIDEIKALPVPKDNRRISESAAKVATTLEAIIAEKKAIIAEIDKMTGVTIDCLDKQTDAAGIYYMCAEGEVPSGFDATPTGQNCPRTAQKCWKLPKENNCETAVAGQEYQCVQTCPSGTEEWKITQKVCTAVPGTKCCRKVITALDKLLGLKNLIQQALQNERKYLETLEQKKHGGDDAAALAELQSPPGAGPEKSPLIAYIDDTIIAGEKGFDAGLKGILELYATQTVDVPSAVTNLRAGEPNTPIIQTATMIDITKGQLLEAARNGAPPTPGKKMSDYIREKIEEIHKPITTLILQKQEAIKALNIKTGINNCDVGYEQNKVTNCFATCPSPLWTQVPNTQCPDISQKCCTAEPKLFYKTATQGETPFMPEPTFKYDDQVTFIAKIPFIEQGGIKDTRISIDSIPITELKTTPAQSHLIVEGTKKIQHPGSVLTEYSGGTISSRVGSQYKSLCPQTKITMSDGTILEYNCRNECITDHAKNIFEIDSLFHVCPTNKCCMRAIPPATPPTHKAINRPAFFAQRCVSRVGEGNYVQGSVIWKEDDVDWAIAEDLPGMYLTANQYLSLCMAEELVKKYGEPIMMTLTTEKNAQCPTGYDQKGWWSNNYDGWARARGTDYTDDYYINLCVKKDAIQELGNFAYLGIQKVDGTFRSCASGSAFRGMFQFKAYPPSTWYFAGAFYENLAYTQLVQYDKIGTGDNWVGLCVKPVQVPIT